MSSIPVTLPDRYHRNWRQPFDDAINQRLEPGCSVLDIGSGRHPAIAQGDRPESVRYVGLDLSRSELIEAGPDAYTETIAADATSLQPQLQGQFDLAISWQVLEHVKDLEVTVGNVRRYLKPGGLFVALFSGSWSAFGVINRVLPHWLGARIVDRTMKRTENNVPVFPAYYDRCTSKALEPLFSNWSEAEISPLFNGAGYFSFFPPLQRVYLSYENAIHARRVSNLEIGRASCRERV